MKRVLLVLLMLSLALPAIFPGIFGPQEGRSSMYTLMFQCISDLSMK